jgi:AraC-like DNA-binding protein
MDRHDVSEEVTAEIVAQLHHEDLKIQHKYDCRGLTYWFDDKRKTAFCLVEAPNKEAIQTMHNDAHGEVANRIIEVDGQIVESFLGRIEDPKKSQNATLNIINDPAFRTIMVTRVERLSFKKSTFKELHGAVQNHNRAMSKTVHSHKGRIVKQEPDFFLTSFDSVTNAVLCAIAINAELERTLNGFHGAHLRLNIGLSAGVPVTEKNGIFEDTVKSAERISAVAQDKIIISSDVRDLYESEHLNTQVDKQLVDTLSPANERFLHFLMDFTEREWQNSTLRVDSFSKSLGYSKSQFYRIMMATTGKSPSGFIHDYRLDKALKLLGKRTENISEVAFETGFNSPAYFSKCFSEKFGILPSKYVRQYLH